MLAGVDACKSGWVVATVDRTRALCVTLQPTIGHVFGSAEYSKLVIDIPMGLLSKGTRPCDSEARQILRHRSCCVFTAPLRQLLACSDWEAACRCRFRTEGKRVSKQAWAIIPKIREVDEAVSADQQDRIIEGHPELSFSLLNGGVPLSSKRKPAGIARRLGLLRASFPDIDSVLATCKTPRQDTLDAIALLWTAKRVASGQATWVGSQDHKDARGLLMRMAA